MDSLYHSVKFKSANSDKHMAVLKIQINNNVKKNSWPAKGNTLVVRLPVTASFNIAVEHMSIEASYKSSRQSVVCI